MFEGDLNGHHQEWLGSTTTNRHRVAAFDFATVFGCDQLVVGPTHARGGILDLLMTDVPWPSTSCCCSKHQLVTRITPLCRQPFRWLRRFQTCVLVGKFLKHQANWNTVCGAIRDLPWRNIWLADVPVEVLNQHPSLLVGRYVPTKLIRVRDKDNPWINDQCRHASFELQAAVSSSPDKWSLSG